MIVGIGHKKCVGKTTLARMLCAKLAQAKTKARVISLASEIKVITNRMFGWAGVLSEEEYEFTPGQKDVLLSELGCTPRRIWQDLGQWARSYHPDVWIRAALSTAQSREVMIVPDVRFPNEHGVIRKLEGMLIRVDRPGTPEDPDISEHALDGCEDWDFVVPNTGDLKNLGQHATDLSFEILKKVVK